MAEQSNHYMPAAALDGAIATVGMTSPVWIDRLETGIHWFLLLGGVVLLVLRLLVAAGEYRSRRGQKRRRSDR